MNINIPIICGSDWKMILPLLPFTVTVTETSEDLEHLDFLEEMLNIWLQTPSMQEELGIATVSQISLDVKSE